MKFNLNDNLIQTTEVFAGKGIHKTVDPEKNTSVSEKRKRTLILIDF